MRQRVEVVLHINLADLTSWRRQRRLNFFAQIADLCEGHGIPIQVCRRDPALMKPHRATPDGKIHIVEDGAAQGEGWLNAALAYLLGFWHLDPNGVLADSAARHDRFTPATVDLHEAQVFFRTLRRRFVDTRLTRYRPEPAKAHDVPDGAIAVFLQGKAPYKAGQCDIVMADMILAACRGAGGRPVVVKPHPLAMTDCAFAIAKAAEAGANFHLFDGNIHDLLAACSVTVSANSAAAMEGFLHRKPAVLFGRSDFQSLVTRAKVADDFPAALDQALTRDWRYPKMLHWYFKRHTIDVGADDFEQRIHAAFAKVGYPADTLGL